MSVLSSHHTVWVGCPGSRPQAERYALDGERMVVFGDRALAKVPDGAQAQASIREIASGPELVRFGVRVHEVDAADVDRQALLELLEHVSLGRDADEVDASIARHGRRRLLVLERTGGATPR